MICLDTYTFFVYIWYFITGDWCCSNFSTSS